MKSYLILDIGNVLVNIDMDPLRKGISKQLNISKSDTDHFISTLQKKQDLGITNMRDEIIVRFNIKSEYIVDELVDLWNSVVQPNWCAINFFSALKKTYKLDIALLSNIGTEHAALFKDGSQWDYFHNLIHKDAIKHFSCEVGARKPTKLFYQSFLQMYPEFHGALYLDDIKENVDAGCEMGLYSIQFDINKNPDYDSIENFFKTHKLS